MRIENKLLMLSKQDSVRKFCKHKQNEINTYMIFSKFKKNHLKKKPKVQQKRLESQKHLGGKTACKETGPLIKRLALLTSINGTLAAFASHADLVPALWHVSMLQGPSPSQRLHTSFELKVEQGTLESIMHQ